MASRAPYHILGVSDDVILIQDQDGGVTVTNDAKAVVEELIQWKGGFLEDGRPYRIHYIDTMGNRDELIHDNGKFIGFRAVQITGRNL